MTNRPLLFWETFEPGAASFFDADLDRYCVARIADGKVSAGYCNICASSTRFVLRADNVREDVFCGECGSINRLRQLTCALSTVVCGDPYQTVATITDVLAARDGVLYTAEANSAMYRQLLGPLGPGRLCASEYFGGDLAPGELVDGVNHEDLRKTSFPDGSFDVVLTSEVFEHFDGVEQAEAEVVRILRPGGTYCFTVPFSPNHDEDIILARDRDDGSVEHLAEPQYHGDPVRPGEGILVYRIFSHRQLQQRFERLGCSYATSRVWSPHLGILGPNSFVMTATRPTAGGRAREGEHGPRVGRNPRSTSIEDG